MPRSGSKARKRKFQGNQWLGGKKAKCNDSITDTDEGSTSHRSASARKLSYRAKATANASAKVNGYRILSLEILSNVLKQVACQNCGESCLYLEEDCKRRQGCSSFLSLVCSSCDWKHCFYTSKKTKKGFEVNKRLVYGMRLIGQGRTSAQRFCGIMNMPPPPKPNAYSKNTKAILEAAKTVAEKCMNDASDEVHALKGSNDEGISQCGVSCDGTWQRRGHSSMNGCVTTLSIDTGKCLDVAVLSKVCRGCQRHKDSDDPKENLVWEAEHKSKCKANYSGSSASMETVGIKQIFGRSQEKYKLQYTDYYGDGNSKGFSEVQDVYSKGNVKVVKKECVGHVQKRVGTALRKLKKENKGLGGKGKLTDALIDRLQNYYGIAIRSNVGNLQAMQNSVKASLTHCISSKKRNLHMFCPDGADSWCRFKQDHANRTSLYKPGTGLPDNITKLVKPIYERLSDDALLTRCLDGKTQNQNESLNGMIWNRLPKEVFVGSDVLKLGVYDAVAHFNIGSQAALNVLELLGIDPGEFCLAELQKADNERVQKADVKVREDNKKKRKIQRAQKKKKADKVSHKEGVTYAAGEF